MLFSFLVNLPFFYVDKFFGGYIFFQISKLSYRLFKQQER